MNGQLWISLVLYGLSVVAGFYGSKGIRRDWTIVNLFAIIPSIAIILLWNNTSALALACAYNIYVTLSGLFNTRRPSLKESRIEKTIGGSE